jgi:hypothetical protein
LGLLRIYELYQNFARLLAAKVSNGFNYSVKIEENFSLKPRSKTKLRIFLQEI